MANLPDFFKGKEMRPFREISKMQKHFFEKLFDEYRLSSGYMPSAELEETEREYILNFDLPGMKKEDIKIDVLGNQLRVSGERKESKESKDRGIFHTERFYGLFERSFTLPQNTKSDEISADYEDGVLKVKVPKAEPGKTQQVKISVGKGKEKAA